MWLQLQAITTETEVKAYKLLFNFITIEEVPIVLGPGMQN